MRAASHVHMQRGHLLTGLMCWRLAGGRAPRVQPCDQPGQQGMGGNAKEVACALIAWDEIVCGLEGSCGGASGRQGVPGYSAGEPALRGAHRVRISS